MHGSQDSEEGKVGEETTKFIVPQTAVGTNGGLDRFLSFEPTKYFTPQSSKIDVDLEAEGLTPGERHQLQEANMETVRSVLERCIAILNSSDFSDSQSFAPVIFTDEDTKMKTTFLHELVWKPKLGSGVTSNSYSEAMDAVLKELEERARDGEEVKRRIAVLLNMPESGPLSLQQTVLHMATLKWGAGKGLAGRLLALGAEVTVRDSRGRLPVARINPRVLEDFLDTKWKPRGYPDEDEDPDNEEYRIEFDFHFLKKSDNETEKQKKVPSDMRVLMDISESQQHRHLLTHPVVTTFLALQWKTISLPYTLNTIFTLLTCIMANIFIFLNYGGDSVGGFRANWTSCNASWRSTSFPSVFEDTTMTVCWALLLICTFGVVVRELIQLTVAWINKDMKEHILSLENWLEAVFIISTIVLIWFTALSEQPVCAMRALAATILLISWVLFFNMVARNPNFHKQNIHITMFFKVMQLFGKIFLVFAPYILAFGLFFYVSLHKDFEQEDKAKVVTGKTCTDIKKEILQEINQKGEFMDKVGFSVLKTMAMFVGELEFSDIPFDNIPYFSHITFLVFVFLIVVVLMNLLTGLAVRIPHLNIFIREFESGWHHLSLKPLCKKKYVLTHIRIIAQHIFLHDGFLHLIILTIFYSFTTSISNNFSLNTTFNTFTMFTLILSRLERLMTSRLKQRFGPSRCVCQSSTRQRRCASSWPCPGAAQTPSQGSLSTIVTAAHHGASSLARRTPGRPSCWQLPREDWGLPRGRTRRGKSRGT